MMPIFVKWMRAAPEAIFLYIPLMKELGLSWSELKTLPKQELEGLLFALSQYSRYHQFDGYDEKDIGEMSKNKPQLRSDYYSYRELKDSYDERLGVKKPAKTKAEIIAGYGSKIVDAIGKVKDEDVDKLKKGFKEKFSK